MKPKLASDDELDVDQRASPEAQETRRQVRQHHDVMHEGDLARMQAATINNNQRVLFMTELTSKQPFHGWRWFADRESIYLELLHGDYITLVDLNHLSEVDRVRDVCCVFRITPKPGIYLAFHLDDEPTITAPKCHLCRCGHRRVDGIHVPTQRIGMIKATLCRSIVAVPCKLVLGRWLAYVDGKPIPDRTWGTANGAVRAARKLSRDRDAGDKS